MSILFDIGKLKRQATVFSSQPKVGSDIRANHITAHSRDVTTDIYVFNILISYFFHLFDLFLSILYIYLIHVFIFLFSPIRRPPSAVRIRRPLPHLTDSPRAGTEDQE